MFNLFRRSCLYNEAIEPHCAYCAHCKPDNEYQGICEFRGIVAMAGSCRRFTYNALRRRPPKPARIRGRFTDEDFFFEEKDVERAEIPAPAVPEKTTEKPLLSADLSEFADLWEDDDAVDAATPEPAASEEASEETVQPAAAGKNAENQPASAESGEALDADTAQQIDTPDSVEEGKTDMQSPSAAEENPAESDREEFENEI